MPSPADYDKPFLSFSEQLALLESRGMRIEDAAEAEHYLRHEGYYRLSSYFYPFLEVDKNGRHLDTFLPEAGFSDLIQIYEFDKWLRTALISALRAVEISVRVAVAHQLGEKDIFAHENPKNVNADFLSRENSRHGKSRYQIWIDKYRHLLTRNDQEDFVRRFIGKYGSRIPIWVAIEIWDFGLLSRFFAGMKAPDRQAVSRQYGVEDPHIFTSWLSSFNYVRNVCAHHSRLWNRHIVEQPRLPYRGEIPLLKHLSERGVKDSGSKTYATLALVTYVLKTMNYRGLWLETINGLLEKFPASPCLSPAMMGAPENRKSLPLWLPE